MIRTIFVPASGSSSDEAVFATALAAARPLRAHLDFHHIRLTAVEAAARAPHVDFCVGGAVPAALRFIEKDVEGLSELAAAHFKSFCAQQAVEIRDTPVADGVSASYLEEHGPAGHHLMIHARHSDLIVLGRPNRVDYMPSMLLEDLLVGSGRPNPHRAAIRARGIDGYGRRRMEGDSRSCAGIGCGVSSAGQGQQSHFADPGRARRRRYFLFVATPGAATPVAGN